MYEELTAPLPSVEAYLERIGLAGAEPKPDAEWLDKLVVAQLTHIPFDDMDVWGAGACPSLAIADLFEKIITKRRGGYCYELNSLFCAFLKALGYDAYTVIVHLVGGRDHLPPPQHCAIVCNIDGEQYFCDVGFGGPVPNGAVRFDGALYHGHRIVKKSYFHIVEAKRGDAEPAPIMVFKNLPALPVELIPLNFNTSQQPDSGFRRMLMLNLRLPNGSASVTNLKFSYRNGEESISRELTGLDDLREVLVKYFGIDPETVPLRELAF